MGNKTSTKSAWIVVEVRSGIPIEVKVFSNKENATGYIKSLREELNLENDETGIFEVDLPLD